MRFRGHKGYQKRRGGGLSRERVLLHAGTTVADAGQLLGVRGGGLEIMIASMSIHLEWDSRVGTVNGVCFGFPVEGVDKESSNHRVVDCSTAARFATV